VCFFHALPFLPGVFPSFTAVLHPCFLPSPQLNSGDKVSQCLGSHIMFLFFFFFFLEGAGCDKSTSAPRAQKLLLSFPFSSVAAPDPSKFQFAFRRRTPHPRRELTPTMSCFVSFRRCTYTRPSFDRASPVARFSRRVWFSDSFPQSFLPAFIVLPRLLELPPGRVSPMCPRRF